MSAQVGKEPPQVRQRHQVRRLPAIYRDALVLARELDGAIFLARTDFARRGEILQTREQLAEQGVPIHGVVANRKRRYVPRFLARLLSTEEA